MTHIYQEAQVPYTTQQMYDLVNQVEHYADFLPWCEQSLVLEKCETHMLATLTIGWQSLHQTFTTRNTLSLPESVAMQLVDGPFQSFDGVWQFQAMGDTMSQVELTLDFTWQKTWMALAFNTVFSQLAEKMLQAFVERAREVYG